MSLRDDGRYQAPDSWDRYVSHEEVMERRAEAIGRHRRQQFELFELECDPGCPNCSAVGGRPVESAETGDEGCTLCVKVRS